MKIRKAEVRDLPLLMEQAQHFIKELNSPNISPSASYMEALGRELLARHVFAVAETDKGEIAGMVAAMYSRSPLDDKCTTLTELFWWVEPEHRGSRAGWLLLKFLEEVAAHYQVPLFMSTLASSPDVEPLLKRHGFVPAERTFVKWVYPQE